MPMAGLYNQSVGYLPFAVINPSRANSMHTQIDAGIRNHKGLSFLAFRVVIFDIMPPSLSGLGGKW